MRAGFLDSLRGIAVIWMIIFHTCYDMKMLGMLDWNFSQGFWYAFPRVIAWTFLFCVGASLNYTHKPKINWSSLGRRSLKLGLSALAVSLGTYFIFPQQWIFFGTLHCILVGSIFGALIVNHRKAAFFLMLLILILQYGLGFGISWVSSIIEKPSMDFIPIYPWFWAILLGMLVGPYLSKNRQVGNLKAPAPLKFLGTHSLKIYLLHQPLIYGTLWVISSLI
ncbi:MAG: DUF1624 domain-containing protein [Bdellovibrionales bacterium]|nr:DUF1624 domain-containing protein [Bdellovibrionales bacterium]